MRVPPHAFTVFAQRSDARFDVAEWDARARRFFDARVGLAAARSYDGAPPVTDAMDVIIARGDAPGSRRHVAARPRDAADLEAAEAADARAGSPGLGLLARRCGYVWLVACEGDDDDEAALLLSAVLASVMLGPILAPGGAALFGVKTARARLDALAARAGRV